MIQVVKYLSSISIILAVILLQNSCVHDSIMGVDLDPSPMDTMNLDTATMDTMNLDTTVMDTTSNISNCDPNKVYFYKDILPILNSNCAYSGCHDVQTAENGVILNSYEKVIITGEIVPFKPSESELFKKINTDDTNKVMPPSGKLNADLIAIIEKWIKQGADNVICDEEIDFCGSEEIKYSGFISSLMKTHCNGCHGTGIASGGIVTDNYIGLKAAADSKRLYGALSWETGFQNMPQDLPQLDSCNLVKVKKWIDEGAQNN